MIENELFDLLEYVIVLLPYNIMLGLILLTIFDIAIDNKKELNDKQNFFVSLISNSVVSFLFVIIYIIFK
jgi:hypothetical protein